MNETMVQVHPACLDCRADFEHCHEASIEHADGRTECVDPRCDLPHVLHEWQLACSVFDPPCPCTPIEQVAPLRVAA